MTENKTFGLGDSENGKTLEFNSEVLKQEAVLASRYIIECKYDLSAEQCQYLVKMAPDDWKSH